MPNYLIRSEGPGYTLVEISKPPVNVLTMEVLEDLAEVFTEIGSTGSRAVLLRGAGKHFSAGADVAEHLPPDHPRMLSVFLRAVQAIMGLDIPTVAHIHGSALGGGLELALACDFVIAAENTRLGLPEIELGVFPPVAAAILPVEIGSRAALELILTGEPIREARALEIGLINRIGTFEDAEHFVCRLVRHPRPSLVACKKAARRLFTERLELADQIYRNELMTHPEPIEGLRSFLERRQPAWEKIS